MKRISFTLEDMQDCQKTVAPLATARSAQTFGLECIEHNLEELPDDCELFNIDAGLSKGGFQYALRTKTECLDIIQAIFPKKDTTEIFEAALRGKYESGWTSIQIEKVSHSQDFYTTLQNTNEVRIGGNIFTRHSGGHFSGETATGNRHEIKISQSPNILKVGHQTWLVTDTTGKRQEVTIPQTPCDAEDQLTNILLEIHQNEGIKGVTRTLRAACVHFAAEYKGDPEEMEPDATVLELLAQAIQTPPYLNQTPEEG